MGVVSMFSYCILMEVNIPHVPLVGKSSESLPRHFVLKMYPALLTIALPSSVFAGGGLQYLAEKEKESNR